MKVHKVEELKLSTLSRGELKQIRTRCGITIAQPVGSANGAHGGYDIVAENGNRYECSYIPRFVTCEKCKSLTSSGTTHASLRPFQAAHVR